MDTNLGSSGLLRYRSAPSSVFTSFDVEDDNIFARFLSEVGEKDVKDIDCRFAGAGVGAGARAEQQMVYHGPPPRPPPPPPPASNLTRRTSSPAGFFGDLSGENGYVIRGVGNYRVGNSAHGDAMPSTSRLKSQMSFSSVTHSSSGLMSPISEIESESIETSNSEGESLGLSNVGNRYTPNFPNGTWDDSALGTFANQKRFRDANTKMNSAENQIQEVGNQTRNLTHHFSLPKTSSEMAAILQFQDSVPCKVRAKRGCATHPRSIAERMRRTRISERMKKLQELVPNMDKQTNTADMLDLAVDYIKDLQKHVKKLNEERANCTCSSTH